MKNLNSYRNFRQLVDRKQNWNLFAGTKIFATDFFLEFLNPAFNMKYIADCRSKNILKTLVWVSLILFVTYEFLYHFKEVGIITLLWISMHVAAYYHLEFKKNYLLSRIFMELPMLLINQFSSLSLWILLIYDLMTLHTWRNHMISILLHALLVNIFIFISDERLLQGQSTQTLVISSYSDVCYLIALMIIEIVIFASLERHLKENWVIKTSNEKSFRAVMSLVDWASEKAVVVDSKGVIIFSNTSLIECTNDTDEHRMSMKISSFIHKNNRDAFLKAINSTVSLNMSTSISIQFLKKTDENGDTLETK